MVHAEILTYTLANPPKPAGTIEIEADALEMHFDRIMHATGNASLKKDGQSAHGDSITYDMQNDELHVLGNAKIDMNDTHLSGPEIRIRMSESLGEMPNATILLDKKPNVAHSKTSKASNIDSYGQSALAASEAYLNNDPKLFNENGNNRMQVSSRGDAEMIFFEGPDKKRLRKMRYTTCEAGVDDWYIKAGEMKLNSYTQSAVATNAYIEFKGIPILYTPYLSFSFSGERKSGFLAGHVGSTSKGGFEVTLPYYWNISPNKDATMTTRYMSNRGVQLQGQFRYLDEHYSGKNSLEYLNNDQQTGDTRYYANLAHSQNFGNGWSASYGLEKVSDNQYFSELSTRITSTSRVNLPQTAQINYTGSVWQLNGLVQKYQTLDGISYPYQRLPQFNLNGNKDWGNYATNLTSQYTYFDRDPRADLAATGSRAVAYPSISMPLLTPYGFIKPKLGLNTTSYSLNNNPVGSNTATRALPIFSVDTGLYFDRDLSIINKSYTQTIEPRMYYVYIPYSNQDQLPVFDTGLADLNLSTLFSENKFTGYDRINNANQLSLALTTRMIDKDSGAERIVATIGQRFYFTDQKVGLTPNALIPKHNTSDVIGSLTARLSNTWKLDSFMQYSPDTGSITRSNLLARYNPEPGKLFNFGYRYTQNSILALSGIKQIDVSGQWPLGRGWYGIGRWNYSLSEHKPIEGIAGLEYDAGCWQARTVIQRIATATAQANYALFFQLELGGLSSIGSNPFNLLRRSIPGYQKINELSDETRQQNFN